MHPTLPIPDPIPAPAPLFHVLELIFFGLHILLINVLLGGSLITLAARIWRPASGQRTAEAIAHKLPVLFALAVNARVATLLFLQVLYGHLFYASSILIGTYWILVIPAIVIAYYSCYVLVRSSSPRLRAFASGCSALLLLSIAFVLATNMLTMLRPDTWDEYFGDRIGAVWKIPDPMFLPRYLHFVVASVAIAGLFSAGVWTHRKSHGIDGSATMINRGLSIFGFATILQVGVGIWLLTSLKQEYLTQFIGRNVVATISIWLGFLCAVASIASAFARQFRPAVIMISITFVAMIIVRDELRTIFLGSVFDPSSLTVVPQFDVLAIFFLTLLIGVGIILWMLRTGFRAQSGRTAP